LGRPTDGAIVADWWQSVQVRFWAYVSKVTFATLLVGSMAARGIGTGWGTVGS
jgi:hypothetical protein